MNGEPNTLEDVESQAEWKSLYESGYVILNSSQQYNFKNVSNELKIDKVIFKAYVKKYHPEYKTLSDTLRSKITEILEDEELKSKFNEAVQKVLADRKLSWVIVAKRLGVTLQTFITYIKHVEPYCVPSKLNLSVTTTQEKVEMILLEPQRKAKYEKAVNTYLTDPSVTFYKVQSIFKVSESTLKYFMECTVPNHAQIRADLMALYNGTRNEVEVNLPSTSAEETVPMDPELKINYDKVIRTYLTDPTLSFMQLVELHNLNHDLLKEYMDRTTPNHQEIREKLEAKNAGKITINPVVARKKKVARRTKMMQTRAKYAGVVKIYLSNPTISLTRLCEINKISRHSFKNYLERTIPDHAERRQELLFAEPKSEEVKPPIEKPDDLPRQERLDQLVNRYLNDTSVNLHQLSKKYNLHRNTLKRYLDRMVPDHAKRRAALFKEKVTKDVTWKDPGSLLPKTVPPRMTGKHSSQLNAMMRNPELRAKYDAAIKRYLKDPSVTYCGLAQVQNLCRYLFKKYMVRTVPNHQEIRAKLLAKSSFRFVQMKRQRAQMRRRYIQPPKFTERATKIETRAPTFREDYDHEEESRVRQFEEQGLCYDAIKNRVTCTSCNVILLNTDTESLARHCQLRSHAETRNSQQYLENTAEVEIEVIHIQSLQHDPLDVSPQFLYQAPKDSVGPGENSWAAQTSQAPMPSTSRAKEMSPRPSTSATHTGGFLIKQDPGTPPPVQQQVMNPYIQEPPMVQSAPRLLPKPSVPPPQSQVQQQPRLRVRQPQHVAPAPAPPDPDPEPQQVCLRWNSFHNNMQTMFPTLLNKEKFVDVTLACEGQTVKCHKVVLSSCSAYIERLLTENPCKHPIILMPNTMRYWQIRALVDFMYRGEVNVEHEQLSSLLAAAEFLQVKGLAGPPTSPEQNTNMEDPEPEPPLSPRPKRKRVASPSPVPQHRQPVATPPTPQPQQQQQQQQQRTSLPNSPAVSITRLKQSTAVAQATPSTSRDTGSRAQSPGIEITPVVSFEEIKMEPIDISDSNDESMDPNMHCDVDYDMDNGDGEGDKDYDDEDLDEDSGDAGRGAEDDTGGGGGDADPGPSLQPSTSDDQPGTSKTTSNGPDLTTPGFSGNGIEIDDSAASYCAADLGLTTEPPEDPPDSGAGNWKRLTKRWRCHYCPRKDDRKTTVRCIRCTNSICPNHRETMYQCGVCENKPIAETLDFPQETDFCHECPPGGNKVAARCITCFKSVCCMHRSEVPHCVKCPALEEQESEKSS